MLQRNTCARTCAACAASSIHSWKPGAGCCVSTQDRQCPCNTHTVGYSPKTVSVQTDSERIVEDTLGSINKLICCSNGYSFNYGEVVQREESNKTGFLLP